MATTVPDAQTIRLLKLLRDRHNVLVSGPPATGKSLLLAAASQWFREVAVPPHTPGGRIPIPRGSVVTGIEDWLPSPERTDRRVFQTAFHQGTKFRDWMRGLMPVPGGAGVTFAVSSGLLYKAAEHASSPNGAALVVVDEINRGPAVQVFGDSLVAIESDKRLRRDGSIGPTSVPIQILDDAGIYRDFYLPFHLYLLAAMNRADTSVEPLDVAFLRRWEPCELIPDPTPVLARFAIASLETQPPPTAATSEEVYLAAARAWRAVNRRIALSRGREYQLGHGVMLWKPGPAPTSLAEALEYCEFVWRRIKDHVDEVFFGDIRGVAAVINASRAGNPYTLEAGFFADTPVNQLNGPVDPTGSELYAVLRAVGSET